MRAHGWQQLWIVPWAAFLPAACLPGPAALGAGTSPPACHSFEMSNSQAGPRNALCFLPTAVQSPKNKKTGLPHHVRRPGGQASGNGAPPGAVGETLPTRLQIPRAVCYKPRRTTYQNGLPSCSCLENHFGLVLTAPWRVSTLGKILSRYPSIGVTVFF